MLCVLWLLLSCSAVSNFFVTPPGSSVHGISQARVSKWVAISFSNVTCKSEGCSVVSDSLQPHGLYCPWNSPGKNTGVGSHSLLQGIFPTQRSNPGILHCRWLLYQLSHQESPKIAQSYLTLCNPIDYTVHGILQARILE